MTSLERVEKASSALKVFPLPSVVLFPGMVLPLHIFEERYRELVKDCLETDRVIALAQPEPGWEGQYSGRPNLRSICCAGVVIWNQKLEDGRYNIIVQGSVRARIIEELAPRKQYREVRAQVLADGVGEAAEAEQLRQSVFELSGRLPQPMGENLLQNAARAKGGGLADAVAAMLISDVEKRQELLGELDIHRRLRRVIDDVGELIGQLSPAEARGLMN